MLIVALEYKAQEVLCKVDGTSIEVRIDRTMAQRQSTLTEKVPGKEMTVYTMKGERSMKLTEQAAI